MERFVELLAPAGSFECMKAAINAGADAVYLGGVSFGARALAKNFEERELLEAIDFCHVRGKKVYLTLNTLLKNEEIEELSSYLFPFYRQGIDAVIVQDFGVLRYLMEGFPNLPIHLSTQMTINSIEALESILRFSTKPSQITRFVPSRELSLEEIKRIRQGTRLEIETFVHGALCYSYSGQCLMSSMLGGRSGNRGCCAQPCRLPYQYISSKNFREEKKPEYPISPKDMCTIEIIPQLIEAGIDSFKIEGRRKGFGYVSGVTRGYRRVMDQYQSLGPKEYQDFLKTHPDFLEEIQKEFMDLYHRGGFSHGFYDGQGGTSMMANKRPNHDGVLVGSVETVRGIRAGIALCEDIFPQDILEIRSGEEKVYEFTVGKEQLQGELFYTNFLPGSDVKPKQNVYRIRNQKLLDKLFEMFLKKDSKVPIHGELRMKVGEPLSFTVSTKNCFYGNQEKNREKTNAFSSDFMKNATVTIYSDVVESSKTQPLTELMLREKLNKTGETPFAFASLSIATDGLSFYPIGKLNEIRRQALEELEKKILFSDRREAKDSSFLKTSFPSEEKKKTKSDERTHCFFRTEEEQNQKENKKMHLQAVVGTPSQLEPVLQSKAMDTVCFDLTDVDEKVLRNALYDIHQAGKQAMVALPRILRYEGLKLLEQYKEVLQSDFVDGFLIRNFDCYPFLQTLFDEGERNRPKERKKPLILSDYNLYAMNQSAKNFLEGAVTYQTCPFELNQKELYDLDVNKMILPIYGRVAFMVTAQCPKRLAGECKNSNKEEKKDRKPVLLDRKPVLQDRKPVLQDRLHKEHLIASHCQFCFATIHNSEIYSLAGCGKEIRELNPYAVRLDFTFENKKETAEVIKTFEQELLEGISPQKSFLFRQTKGHFLRGVQ